MKVKRKLTLLKKRSVLLRISSVNVTKSNVTFTEEIVNGKRHFLCSVLTRFDLKVKLTASYELRNFQFAS